MPAALIHPDTAYQASYIAAIEELQNQDRRRLDLDLQWLKADFEAYLRRIHRHDTQPALGRVTQTRYWLVEGDNYIGQATLRHRLNEHLRQIGGHIGYTIRPSQRRQGYGTLICKLVLQEARGFGFHRVLITCDETNTASRKIIEANGGVFEKSVTLAEHPAPVLHFWVTLDPVP